MRFLVSVILGIRNPTSDLTLPYACRTETVHVKNLDTFELKLQKTIDKMMADFREEFGFLALPLSHSITKL